MTKKKILIVDDEGTTRTMLTLELESAGYQVFQAEDGDVGYRVARSVKPDLIISDILMSPLDGNKFLKKLRASEFGKNIAFVILTVRAQMQDYFEMMKVDDFITKPFEPGDLLARIERVLDKSKKKKQVAATNAEGSDSSRKKRVLILDNDNETYEKFEKILTENAYEVSNVKTVPACLDSVVTFKPDLVALTFVLDGTNGDKLVTAMKGMPYIKDVPLVVYSHKIRGWEEKSLLNAGAACFIGDVTEEKLLQTVRKITLSE